MRIIKYLLSSLIIILVLNQTGVCQQISFKRYGIEEGLIHPSIYTINQDKNGFIWLGTGAGICRYDGLHFSTVKSNDSLSQIYVNVSFCDNLGRVWFGFDDGTLAYFNGKKVIVVFRDIQNPSLITSITQNEKGELLATTQNEGIIVVDASLKATKIKEPFSGELLYSSCFLNERYFLLGTGNGLFIYDYSSNSIKKITKVKDIPDSKIQCIIPRKDNKSY